MDKFDVQLLGETFKCAYIHKEEEAMRAIQLLAEAYPKGGSAVLGLDIETCPKKGYEGHGQGGLNPHLSEIATVQIYAPDTNNVFVFHVKQFAYGVKCLSNFIETRNFVAHFALFEMQHLVHNQVIPKSLGCSMLLFRLLLHAIHPEPGAVKTSLESLANCAFKLTLDKELQTSAWGSVALTEAQKVYAVNDAILTQRGALWCLEKMRQYDVLELVKFYKVNKDAQLAIAQMILNGLQVDTTLHNTFIAQWEKEEAEALEELEKSFPPGLNPRSSKQLSDYFTAELSKTDEGKAELAEWPLSEKTNNLVCDADTLSMFDDLPAVAPLSKYKKVNKLLTTYGKSLQNCICPDCRRIHSDFTQCYTATGRLSSRTPNIQNLPAKNKAFKNIFVPRKGYKIVAADLGQIEVRVFAMTSGDEQLMAAFEQGIDPYILITSKILKKPMADVTKPERQRGKSVFLGRLYGMGAKTLQKYAWANFQTKLDLAEAKAYIKGIDQNFPTGCGWQKAVSDEASQTLVTTSRMGKIRRLKPDKYYSISMNHPIQSDSCAIALKALELQDAWIRKTSADAYIINCVHDSLINEVSDKIVDIYSAALTKNMIAGVKFVFPEATERGLVKVTVGDSWGDAERD